MPPRRARSGIFQCFKPFCPAGRTDKALSATENIAFARDAMGSVRMLGMVDHGTDGSWPGCWCWPLAANDPEQSVRWNGRVGCHHRLLAMSSAISFAISSTVCVAVLRATLSAKDGLYATTSCFDMLCQMGNRTCSPDTERVTIPSSS